MYNDSIIMLKKIESLVKSMPCVATQKDLCFLYDQLKSLQTPSVKWITK